MRTTARGRQDHVDLQQTHRVGSPTAVGVVTTRQNNREIRVSPVENRAGALAALRPHPENIRQNRQVATGAAGKDAIQINAFAVLRDVIPLLWFCCEGYLLTGRRPPSGNALVAAPLVPDRFIASRRINEPLHAAKRVSEKAVETLSQGAAL